ncbi:uracil-DNA glycosylase [Exilibacterium tricleocarpae]|uniref:Uracil-DNA glycosylase n=1 Tax=Exilibacterium tricleocarpae TaxID=2591008 RepID=A0A545U3I8_9GAMM|nr:uracil-DNA glycosylase [Exilibacterium tricleocarpae]TQV84039.1 uracil-DNA glycosylase [Exilibacterium tricleocarpae]
MTDNGAAIQLHPSWLERLGDQFEQPYMQTLKQFLVAEKQQGKIIYPPGSLIFNALNSTPFDRVKVVILGQDPYHGPNQAHGLCFSVMPGVPFPPSLLNIFKEIQQDLGIALPNHGSLQSWADQGVLLLNATLTVQQARAGSHQGRGWEQFTDRVIQLVNDQREGVVFLLWGSYAQKKGQFIDGNKHLVLKSPHPSPLSAHRGFFGNRHFSRTNEYLQQQGQAPIDWQLPVVGA